MRPWEQEVPPVLYKFVRPERFDVLTGCRIRFSQRAAFEDDRELQPDYATFGNEGEIWEMLLTFQITQPGDQPIPTGRSLHDYVALVAKDPVMQEAMKEKAIASTRSPDEVGILCLTSAADSTRMWNDYAVNSTGFVIAFETGHPGFESLRSSGRLGKVDYSDNPFGSYLGTAFERGAGIFYRKRMKYAFEQEWRSIRKLKYLERSTGGIYLGKFDPAAIRQIIMTSNCSVQKELRDLVSTDWRYREVKVTVRGGCKKNCVNGHGSRKIGDPWHWTTS